jgi:ferredoxin-type protein NapH
VSTLAAPRPNSLRSSWPGALAAALVSGLLVAFLTMGSGGTAGDLLVRLPFVALAFGATLYILRTGRVHGTRLLIFVLANLFFGIVFEISHQVNRGSILLTPEIAATVGAPICPLTVGFVVPPLLIRGEMIFPSTLDALRGVGFMWLGFGLLLGRGWCSWLCFFGGIDQFFSHLGPTRKGGRPLVEIPEPWLRYMRLFPYALLLFLILVAIGTLEPIFCAWLCPLRLAYDPPAVTQSIQWLTAIVVVTLGMGLLVVGPFLTKRRLFCSFGCPLLPLNAVAGLLSPFRVKIDRERCKDCDICVRSCPHAALTAESVRQGKVNLECTRCGRCMDKCPRQAIDYHLLGSGVRARAALVALGVAFGVMFLSGYVLGLLNFVLTGKMPVIGGA